jgi:hypothetical protein
MFRTPTIAALALALMSSAALAQPAGPSADSNGPPAQLSGGNQSYDDRDGPPPGYPNGAPGQNGPQGQPTAQQAQAMRSRDMFCRHDAAARTGYVTPGQAASNAQTSGSVGGALGGAALGAAIGSASHAAGAGALIGAGAGLIAGTAIGSDNARHAASDVERAYSDAYYACMDEADDRGPPPTGANYAYDGPPPPGYYPPYYGYGSGYPYYYPGYYYGPGVSLGFRFGGGYRGGYGRHR